MKMLSEQNFRIFGHDFQRILIISSQYVYTVGCGSVPSNLIVEQIKSSDSKILFF